jgi:hypothetical protein
VNFTLVLLFVRQLSDHELDNELAQGVEPKQTEKPLQGLGLFAFMFVAVPLLLVAFSDWLYVEIATRQEITLIVHDKWANEVTTNQGSFRFPSNWRRGKLFGLRFAYWNDLQSVSLPKLKVGCSYRVVMTGAGFLGDHPLGQNRAPPLNTIVKVLRRMEETEKECDVSGISGKPVCRLDQVTIQNGIIPKSKDCDFESFAKEYIQNLNPQ